MHEIQDIGPWLLPTGLVVSLAEPQDVDAIVELWTDADAWMRRRGIEPGVPPLPLYEIISRRIARGKTCIARRTSSTGEIVGTITLEWVDDGVWSDRRSDEACYVHGLATKRAHAGQGIGLALLQWAEERARAAGKSYLRLDCDPGNPALRAYYERAGLTNCGDVDAVTHAASRFEKRVTSR